MPPGIAPSQNDVLSGKGKGAQNHKCNKIYRTVIAKWKPEYVNAKTTKDKGIIASKVRNELSPAKFLIREGGDDLWYLMDEVAIISKIKQALGEKVKSRVMFLQVLEDQSPR